MRQLSWRRMCCLPDDGPDEVKRERLAVASQETEALKLQLQEKLDKLY